MSHDYDGSSIDLEKALDRYMVERRISRRQLLERDREGRRGRGARADHRRVHAVGRRQPVPARVGQRGGLGSASAAAAAAERGRAAEPTPVPSPEAELFVYNWTEYIGEDTIPSFEEKYGIKVTYDFFSNTDEAYAKLGDDGGGYDVSFPISVDIPAFVAKGALLELDKSLLPNIGQPRHGMGGPGLRPGQRALHAVHVVDDRRRLRHEEDHRHADQQQGALGRALRQAHRDARRLAGGLRRWRSSSSATPPTPTDHGQLDEALALLEQQKPLVRVYTTEHQQMMSSGDNWIGHIWGADIYTIQEVEREHRLLHPGGGRRQGLGHDGRSSRAPSTRSPRTCSSTTCSMRRSAPTTRTTSTTWARTPPPRSSSTRRSWPTRRQPGPGDRRQAPGAARPGPGGPRRVPEAVARCLAVEPPDAGLTAPASTPSARGGGRRDLRARARRSARLAAGRCSSPGVVWLVVFFVVPLAMIFVVSLGSRGALDRIVARPRRPSTTTRGRFDPASCRRSSTRCATRRRPRSCRWPSATRSPTGSAATAAATRPCC